MADVKTKPHLFIRDRQFPLRFIREAGKSVGISEGNMKTKITKEKNTIAANPSVESERSLSAAAPQARPLTLTLAY